MRVDLKVRNTDMAGALQGYIQHRLEIDLGRFSEEVGRVRVKVSGVNGPRGGTKRSFRISAEFKPFVPVTVHETDLDLYAAIDRATGRMGRLLRQRLEKLHESRFTAQIMVAA